MDLDILFSLRRHWLPLEKRRLVLDNRQEDAFNVGAQLGVDFLLFAQSRPDLYGDTHCVRKISLFFSCSLKTYIVLAHDFEFGGQAVGGQMFAK